MRKYRTEKKGWAKIRSVFVYFLAFIMVASSIAGSVLLIKEATMTDRERTKARLMYMIEHGLWDPFSSSMSLEEYFALMELYDDGKLPLKKSVKALAEGDESSFDSSDETDVSGMGGPANRLYFPREKFLLSGLDLTNYKGSASLPLPYNSNNRYGPHDPNTYAKTTATDDKGEDKEYTTNTLVRYTERSATFQEILDDNTLGGINYVIVDGLLCYEDEPTKAYVPEGDSKPHFRITALPNGDTDKEGWEYELSNGVLYLIYKNDGNNVENEDRPYIRIYTPRYYEMDGVQYVFQEDELHVHQDENNSDNNDYNRLYNYKYEDDITPYEFAFWHEKTKKFYVRHDDSRLYDENGTLYELSANVKENIFESLSTGTTYILSRAVNNDALFKYEEDNEKDGYAGDPFNEDAVDYYIVKGQLCVWRNGTLYLPDTDEKFSIDGVEADQFVKELAYYYPEGLDTHNASYMRPPRDWLGLLLSRDTETDQVRRVSIVQETENRGRIAGYVRQDLFGTPILDDKGNISGFESDGIQYDSYYIKRVTLNSANVNVLGIIWAEDLGKYVYYYLSAEGQSTQVSTTTLGENQKFIIEYTPFEYEVTYRVEDSTGLDITWVKPGDDVVMFGSNTPTELDWLDSIFGANRPTRTVDGAYSFDVLVPYGYEVRIIIKVTRNIEGGPYRVPDSNGDLKELNNIEYRFQAGIDHTSSRETVMNTWLASYGQYLVENKIITGIGDMIDRNGTPVVVDDKIIQGNLTSFINDYVKINKDEKGIYSFEWKKDDYNKSIHDGVFKIIAERINDIRMHNSALDEPETGFPLGRYPVYNVQNDSKQLPSKDGPAAFTFTDTFYNHLVKADREIVAVLEKLKDPEFSAIQVLHAGNAGGSNGGRGSFATAEWAYATEDELINHYETYLKDGSGILSSSATHPNIKSYDEWNWNKSSFYNSAMSIANPPSDYFTEKKTKNEDGSYNFNVMFQTNSGDDFYMDVLEINGVALQIPFRPRYVSSNYGGKKADEAHPWYTTGTLPDGAKVTVEFWFGWNSSATRSQHHYRIRIEGVRTNVTISGLNIMQYTSGAREFVAYNLVGVYSDLNGETQQQEAIEYYGKENQNASDVQWFRAPESTMYVNCINDTGDKDNGGANLRFKIADGYGTPYFIWDTLRSGIKYASVPVDGDVPDTTRPYAVINFSTIQGEINKLTLETNTIYYDDRQKIGEEDNAGYGYYYVRIEGIDGDKYSGDKMALLTVVARTVKYTVRYVPYVDNVNGSAVLGDGYAWETKNDVTLYNYPFSGYVMDRVTGELKPMTEDLLINFEDSGTTKKFLLNGESMPLTVHDWEKCALADTLRDEDGNLPGVNDPNYKYLQILHEYDDYGGNYYDLIYNTVATVASDENGIIRPKDIEGQFAFVSWIVVGEDYQPVTDDDGNYIFFNSGAIDFKLYSQYTVKHLAFGTSEMDINVLRLMPVWRANRDTTTYRIVLNWVDALGQLHAEDYSDMWDDIITEKTDSGILYIFLNQDARPLQNWIATHPTYNFWNAVNNATTDNAVKIALDEYVGNLFDLSDPDDAKAYNNILAALTQKEFYIVNEDGEEVMQDPHAGFKRLGSDIFALDFEKHLTISIWMYENKGGFVFRKEVSEEPFVADDEFYFTVINAQSGTKTVKDENGEDVTVPLYLKGSYKAYPQFVYEADGTVREPRDTDAYIVTFDDNGNISQMQTYNATERKWMPLTEKDANNNEIKDENGEPILVTYFTLKHDEGIRLYVPNGQYTIVELGSKSGGSYQAHVEYKSSDGSPAPDSWQIQGEKDSVWLKGDTNVTDSGASQVYVTVDFEIGEHKVVQILTFYNQTTSLSLEKTLDSANKAGDKNILEKYQKITFTLKVTLQLPSTNTGTSGEDVDTSKPIVGYDRYLDEDNLIPDEKSIYYYFTANRYTGRFEKDEEASTESNTVEREIVDQLKIRFTETGEKNQWTALVPINVGERIVIIMTADYDNINYWVEELDNELLKDADGQDYWRIPGYVYAKRIQTLDENGNPMKDTNDNPIYYYQYTYYETLAEAKEKHNIDGNKIFENTLIDDTDYKLDEYIQPATLAKMGLKPLISPNEGSAQKGKKDIVSIVNWYGDLPGYGYLRLTCTVTDGNMDALFIFKIRSARGAVLYVTLKPGQEVYIFLQSGIYTIEEMNWGWRYDSESGTVTDPTKEPAQGGNTQNKPTQLSVTVSQENDSRKKAVQADYTFSPNYKGWLGNESGIKKSYESVSNEESGETQNAG